MPVRIGGGLAGLHHRPGCHVVPDGLGDDPEIGDTYVQRSGRHYVHPIHRHPSVEGLDRIPRGSR